MPASTLFPTAPQGRNANPIQTNVLGGGTVEEPTVSHKEKIHPNPTLKHTRAPLDMGVPYTPRVDNHAQGTGKKVLIDIPDTTPRPTVKPKDAESVDKDIFVDLSPLATSVGVIEKQNEREERDPMDFTPPPFDLGIDLSSQRSQLMLSQSHMHSRPSRT